MLVLVFVCRDWNRKLAAGSRSSRPRVPVIGTGHTIDVNNNKLLAPSQLPLQITVLFNCRILILYFVRCRFRTFALYGPKMKQIPTTTLESENCPCLFVSCPTTNYQSSVTNHV